MVNAPSVGLAGNGYREFEVRTPRAFFTLGLNSGNDAREDGDISQAPSARLAEFPRMVWNGCRI